MTPLYLLYTVSMFAVGVIALGVLVFLWATTKEAVWRDVLFFFTSFSFLMSGVSALPKLWPDNHLLQPTWLTQLARFAPLIYALISVACTLVIIRLYVFRSGETPTPHFDLLCQQSNITSREQDVIRLILQGRCNREISEDLMITVSTVKKYITSIYRKLDLKSRDELITLFTDV